MQGIGPLFEGFGDKAHSISARCWRKPDRQPQDTAIDVLETDGDDPFEHEPRHQQWLVTTCLGAVAGSILVGGSFLGLLGGEPGWTVVASVQTDQLWHGRLGSSKTNFYRQMSEAGAGPAGKDGLAAGGNGQRAGDLVVPARVLAGGIASEYPGISPDLLPYSGAQLSYGQGPVQLAALATNSTTIAKTPPPEPVDETLVLATGQSLVGRLVDLGVTVEAAELLVAAIEPIVPAHLIKPGQKFTITLDKQQDFYGNDVIYPVRLSFSPGPDEEIVVEAELEGQFVARIEGSDDSSASRYAASPHYVARGKIESSFYGAAVGKKVPPYIIAQMLQVFSFDVDFQRQIRPGDTFEAFYGNPLSGSSTKRKVLHFASLTLNGKKKAYYRFTTPDDAVTAYYDEDGRSASKFLMRTPVSGARMTSNYGPRRHPLLGYTRMHTGVDFGLPHGTPIKAAGTGKVSFAGRAGAYGITVRIKHEKGYETVYAHMSKIASGVQSGTSVNQGQIIGYVGSTGRSTGPHLHYEIRVGGKPVNPMKVRAAGGRHLSGEMLAAFQAHRRNVVALMESAPPSTRLARVD